MDWVDAQEELPAEGEEVLIYIPYTKQKLVAYTNSCYSTLWCIAGQCLPVYYQPSHWLRLPKLEI